MNKYSNLSTKINLYISNTLFFPGDPVKLNKYMDKMRLWNNIEVNPNYISDFIERIAAGSSFR